MVAIKYDNNINWGEVYEASHWKSDETVLYDDFGIVYIVEQNSDAWQYQLTEFDAENSTWNEL